MGITLFIWTNIRTKKRTSCAFSWAAATKERSGVFLPPYSAVMSDTKTSTLDAPNPYGQYPLLLLQLSLLPRVLPPGSAAAPAGNGDSGSGYVLWHEHGVPALALPFQLACTSNPSETTWESPAQKEDSLFFILRHCKTRLSWDRGSLYPHTALTPRRIGSPSWSSQSRSHSVCLDCEYFISPLICFIKQQLEQSQRRRGHACKKAINTTQILQFGIFSFLFLQQKSQVFYPLPTQHLTHKLDTKLYSYFFLLTNRL